MGEERLDVSFPSRQVDPSARADGLAGATPRTLAGVVWAPFGGKPRQNRIPSMGKVPAKTEGSDRLAKELAKLGFKFVGSTICYAHMQATGMVDDHTTDCFRYRR